MPIKLRVLILAVSTMVADVSFAELFRVSYAMVVNLSSVVAVDIVFAVVDNVSFAVIINFTPSQVFGQRTT